MKLSIWHWLSIITATYIFLVVCKLGFNMWQWSDRQFSMTVQCEESKLFIDYDGLNMYMTSDSTKPLESRRSFVAGPDKKLETIDLPDDETMKIDRLNGTVSIGKSSCKLIRFERISK